jgi:hypothetical protein
MEAIRINARDLGQVLLDNFCERCFWFAKKFPLGQNHPFASPMPSIVSQADTYIKRVVNTHLQETGSLPSWLISELKGSFLRLNFQSVRRVNPAKWQIRLFEAPCVLVGEADAIWEFPDGSWFIADYKMASMTQTQERLLPLYQAQLNAYAYLAQRLQRKTIAGLALIYFEPEHNTHAIADPDLLQRTMRQLMLGFRCTIVPVDSQTTGWVEDLCRQVFRILSSSTPPTGRQGCQGCQALSGWLESIGKHRWFVDNPETDRS